MEPLLVLVTLNVLPSHGVNEAGVKAAFTVQVPGLEQIVETVGKLEYAWIAPPAVVQTVELCDAGVTYLK